MAMKLGTLQVDITADASGLRAAESVVNTTTKKIEKELGNVERAANTAASGGIKNFGNVTRQLGYQVQDVAVQLSAGTNAMAVLSQQGSQIASVFGPAGAVVGAFIAVGAAIGGALLPSLFKSKDATEELDEAMKKLGETLKETDTGAVILTEKFEQMAAKSREAAELSLRGSLVVALEAADTAMGELKKSAEEFQSVTEHTKTGFFRTGDAAQELADKYGITRDEVLTLGDTLRNLAIHQDQFMLDRLLQNLAEIAKRQAESGSAATFQKQKFAELAKQISDAAMKYADLTGQADAMKTMLGDVDAALAKVSETGTKHNDTVEKYIQKLKIEAETLGMSRVELEAYNATQMKADSLQAARIAAYAREIEAFNAAQEAKRKAEAEEKKRQQEAEAQRKKDDARIKQIEAMGLSERDAIQKQFEETREFILGQDQLTYEKRKELLDIAAAQRQKDLEMVNKKEIEEAKKVRDETVQAAKDMTSGISGIMRQSGDEQAARAADIIDGVANMAIQMSTIYAAQAQASEMGSPANPTLAQKMAGVAAVMRMASSILSVIKAAKGGGRQHGGNVSPMLAHPINEQGAPEILNQAGKQYLLPTGKGGTITPMKSGAGGGVVVNLISNGTPQTVTGTSMSRGEVTVMIDDAVSRARREINSSLATGRGDTAASLKTGFEVRNKLR